MKFKFFPNIFKKIGKSQKFYPIKIYKQNNSYYISIKELTEKFKFFGVIFDKRMRVKHAKYWNNLIALGVL